MSYSSGRAWQTAGQGLLGLGDLLQERLRYREAQKGAAEREQWDRQQAGLANDRADRALGQNDERIALDRGAAEQAARAARIQETMAGVSEQPGGGFSYDPSRAATAQLQDYLWNNDIGGQRTTQGIQNGLTDAQRRYYDRMPAGYGSGSGSGSRSYDDPETSWVLSQMQPRWDPDLASYTFPSDEAVNATRRLYQNIRGTLGPVKTYGTSPLPYLRRQDPAGAGPATGPGAGPRPGTVHAPYPVTEGRFSDYWNQGQALREPRTSGGY